MSGVRVRLVVAGELFGGDRPAANRRVMPARPLRHQGWAREAVPAHRVTGGDTEPEMQTSETSTRPPAVYVTTMTSLENPWLSLLSVLAAGVIAACSPGAVPVSQSPTDPSNPSAAEGVSPQSAAAPAPPMSTHPSAEHGGHEPHGQAPAAPSGDRSVHAGHGGMPDAGPGK